jgi:hypothetical protein
MLRGEHPLLSEARGATWVKDSCVMRDAEALRRRMQASSSSGTICSRALPLERCPRTLEHVAYVYVCVWDAGGVAGARPPGAPPNASRGRPFKVGTGDGDLDQGLGSWVT